MDQMLWNKNPKNIPPPLKEKQNQYIGIQYNLISTPSQGLKYTVVILANATGKLTIANN
jgi:hypothetical protein